VYDSYCVLAFILKVFADTSKLEVCFIPYDVISGSVRNFKRIVLSENSKEKYFDSENIFQSHILPWNLVETHKKKVSCLSENV